jgi:poly(beta-D-mannuronate) lyase
MILRVPNGLRVAIVLAAVLVVAGALDRAEAARACPSAPPPVRDLDLVRYYTDEAGSIVDPALRARNVAALKPVTAFLRHVVRDADTAVRRNSAPAATCALDWLAQWARGEAWLGRMATSQAEYQRKWDLAGVALAYLKVRPWASAEQRAAIEPWLTRLADAARAFFDDPRHKRNNHWYWLGLGVAATGLATDSDRHWAMARAIFQDAARDIGPDGSLPLELKRGKRALGYHTFALTPLSVMAELAHVRGEDWYRLGDGALHRLVALAARGLADPGVIAALAGVPQEPQDKAGAAWMQLYRRRFPGRLPDTLPAGAGGHRWLGGDVMLLATALSRPAR